MTSHEDYRRKLWNKLKRVNGAVMAESNIVGWRGTGRWAKRLSLPSSKSGLIDRRNRIEFSLALLFFSPGPCYPPFIEASTTCSSFGAGEKREPMRRSSYRQFGYLWRIHWSLSARVCVCLVYVYLSSCVRTGSRFHFENGCDGNVFLLVVRESRPEAKVTITSPTLDFIPFSIILCARALSLPRPF